MLYFTWLGSVADLSGEDDEWIAPSKNFHPDHKRQKGGGQRKKTIPSKKNFKRQCPP